jgi:GrpB-like predicted nucleotidyltransferase (UPF0157 family)
MGIQVVPYSPEWKTWFLELRNQIWPQISDLVLDIVHVGSTSIEGMSAKPIIDIDIVVDSMDYFKVIKARLSRLGYIHQGDLGIKGREAFKLDYDPKLPHHLYLCPVDSGAYRNHTLLKKHLAENPDAFKRYNDLKLGLADTADSIDTYWRSKTLLILEFLEKEGLNQDELESIREDNL